MDEQQREGVNLLFAEATALLEDAIETAVAGQSYNLDDDQMRGRAEQLLPYALRSEAIATEALAMVKRGTNHSSDNQLN